MTWYADLSECAYFPAVRSSKLRAVGWLARGEDYPMGTPEPQVYERLCELLADPWQPFATMGWHDCDLCRFEPEARGFKNLFVPGNESLYVCPELIRHYINTHGYCPPEEFCAAVLKCPDTRTMEYKRLFLANGGRGLAT